MPEIFSNASPQQETAYFQEVLKSRGLRNLCIRHADDGRGKAIFVQKVKFTASLTSNPQNLLQSDIPAPFLKLESPSYFTMYLHVFGLSSSMPCKEVEAGEILLRDIPLAAIQLSANKEDCLCCSRCCRFLGSIELQVAWKMRSSGVISPEMLQEMQNGDAVLPLSDHFPMPKLVACEGRCDELYCSEECSQLDWTEHHSLLCTGEASPSQQDPKRLEALQQFHQMCVNTNDIFLLAAKVLAAVLLKARSESQRASSLPEAARLGKTLEVAWRPFAVGWKKLWWECVAIPEDVNEVEFRQEMKELAREALELLKAAIFDHHYRALFDLDVYGGLIGMFELNNLGFSFPSPLSDWLDAVKDHADAGVASSGHQLSDELLQALEEDLAESSSCEGTGFHAIQSCANHSCVPNASVHCTASNECILTAKRKILEGEEVFISYVDEDAPWSERQEAFQEYGFECKCNLCLSQQQDQEQNNSVKT